MTAFGLPGQFVARYLLTSLASYARMHRADLTEVVLRVAANGGHWNGFGSGPFLMQDPARIAAEALSRLSRIKTTTGPATGIEGGT
jgi:hypothetical protein